MAELEETFVQQLQKVTETYKREVSEQQARQAEIEDQLTAAQGELAAAQAQAEVSQQALENLRSHPPPVGPQPLMILCSYQRECHLCNCRQLKIQETYRLTDQRRHLDLLHSGAPPHAWSRAVWVAATQSDAGREGVLLVLLTVVGMVCVRAQGPGWNLEGWPPLPISAAKSRSMHRGRRASHLSSGSLVNAACIPSCRYCTDRHCLLAVTAGGDCWLSGMLSSRHATAGGQLSADG